MFFLAPSQGNQGWGVQTVQTKTEYFNNVQCLEPTRQVGIRALLCNIRDLFWPVRQSRAAVENNLSLSQNTLIS